MHSTAMLFPELTDRLLKLIRNKHSGQAALTMQLDRVLTEEEHTLVAWLLEHGEAGAQNFLPQLEHMRVHGKCSCGCPSIDLNVSTTIPSIYCEAKVLADFLGTIENNLVGVLLHQSGGRLRELEIYALGDIPTPFGLPDISTLHSFESTNVASQSND